MMRSRSWLVPLLDGLPYIDKPVLFHWLQALFIRILGKRSSRFGSRAPVQAVALFGVTRWVGGEFFDDETANGAP